jgi:N-acetylmuramic acid 6-phosphate etherase
MASGADENKAAEVLEETKYDVKLAIFMIKTSINKDEAARILEENGGYIQRAIDSVNGRG